MNMREDLFTFRDETCTAIACEAMNRHYPNVHFEGVEDGSGGYRVGVVPLHDNPIHRNTVNQFRNELIFAYEVACVAVRMGVK